MLTFWLWLRAEIVPDKGRRGPGGGQQLRVLPGVTGRLQPGVILPGGWKAPPSAGTSLPGTGT